MMDVMQALQERRSVRAFLSTPVEQEKLEAVLEAALRSPSWANSQPWEIYVASGKTLESIKQGFKESREAHVASEPDTPRPTEWTQAAIERRNQLFPDMQRDCGEAVKDFGYLNETFFNAPAVVYICMDRVLSAWSLYDIGAFSQSFMLAATELGLGTIPAMTLTQYPGVLHKELDIPDSSQITIGIALGYIDPDNQINSFRSARTPLEEAVRFFD